MGLTPTDSRLMCINAWNFNVAVTRSHSDKQIVADISDEITFSSLHENQCETSLTEHNLKCVSNNSTDDFRLPIFTGWLR